MGGSAQVLPHIHTYTTTSVGTYYAPIFNCYRTVGHRAEDENLLMCTYINRPKT